jgi:hypothetical protein
LRTGKTAVFHRFRASLLLRETLISRERKTSSPLSETRTSRVREARETIVARWKTLVEVETGVVPDDAVADTLRKHIGRAQAQSIAFETLEQAVEILVDRGYGPGLYPHVVLEAAQRSARGTDLVEPFLHQHGGKWPTGSRWVRGTHGGSFVQDPLGYDRPTHSVPWGPPTRKEVLDALRRQ